MTRSTWRNTSRKYGVLATVAEFSAAITSSRSSNSKENISFRNTECSKAVYLECNCRTHTGKNRKPMSWFILWWSWLAVLLVGAYDDGDDGGVVAQDGGHSLIESLNYCWFSHDVTESCNVCFKSGLYRGIWLSEQFLLRYCYVFDFFQRYIHAFVSKLIDRCWCSINLWKTFPGISSIRKKKKLWPESWRESLHIYFLSFPRFWP